MELNILTILYLFFRLAPFILVSFFSLASIFNQDFKGLIYLIGLIFACFITMMIGNVLPSWLMAQNPSEICNMITIGNTPAFSKLPLGQCIFGYTFFYLLYTMYKNKVLLQNYPTLIFFPLVIIVDMFWNLSNGCYNVIQLPISLLIGGGIGYLWSYILYKSKNTGLQYFNKITGKDVCSRPTKNTFKCSVYKNGKLISKNI
jgi:hypothetical protein